MSVLRIYLRNHEAAAQAGRDLFRRASKTQRSEPWAADLQALASAVDADVRSLRQLMKALSTNPDRVAGLVLRAGEHVGRLKPNGHLISRSPLSNLIEVEGLLDAVRAKRAGWTALEAARALPANLEPLLEDLLRRADSQLDRLERLHRQVASTVLTPVSRDS